MASNPENSTSSDIEIKQQVTLSSASHSNSEQLPSKKEARQCVTSQRLKSKQSNGKTDQSQGKSSTKLVTKRAVNSSAIKDTATQKMSTKSAATTSSSPISSGVKTEIYSPATEDSVELVSCANSGIIPSIPVTSAKAMESRKAAMDPKEGKPTKSRINGKLENGKKSDRISNSNSPANRPCSAPSRANHVAATSGKIGTAAVAAAAGRKSAESMSAKKQAAAGSCSSSSGLRISAGGKQRLQRSASEADAKPAKTFPAAAAAQIPDAAATSRADTEAAAAAAEQRDASSRYSSRDAQQEQTLLKLEPFPQALTGAAAGEKLVKPCSDVGAQLLLTQVSVANDGAVNVTTQRTDCTVRFGDKLEQFDTLSGAAYRGAEEENEGQELEEEEEEEDEEEKVEEDRIKKEVFKKAEVRLRYADDKQGLLVRREARGEKNILGVASGQELGGSATAGHAAVRSAVDQRCLLITVSSGPTSAAAGAATAASASEIDVTAEERTSAAAAVNHWVSKSPTPDRRLLIDPSASGQLGAGGEGTVNVEGGRGGGTGGSEGCDVGGHGSMITRHGVLIESKQNKNTDILQTASYTTDPVYEYTQQNSDRKSVSGCLVIVPGSGNATELVNRRKFIAPTTSVDKEAIVLPLSSNTAAGYSTPAGSNTTGSNTVGSSPTGSWFTPVESSPAESNSAESTTAGSKSDLLGSTGFKTSRLSEDLELPIDLALPVAEVRLSPAKENFSSIESIGLPFRDSSSRSSTLTGSPIVVEKVSTTLVPLTSLRMERNEEEGEVERDGVTSSTRGSNGGSVELLSGSGHFVPAVGLPTDWQHQSTAPVPPPRSVFPKHNDKITETLGGAITGKEHGIISAEILSEDVSASRDVTRSDVTDSKGGGGVGSGGSGSGSDNRQPGCVKDNALSPDFITPRNVNSTEIDVDKNGYNSSDSISSNHKSDAVLGKNSSLLNQDKSFRQIPTVTPVDSRSAFHVDSPTTTDLPEGPTRGLFSSSGNRSPSPLRGSTPDVDSDSDDDISRQLARIAVRLRGNSEQNQTEESSGQSQTSTHGSDQSDVSILRLYLREADLNKRQSTISTASESDNEAKDGGSGRGLDSRRGLDVRCCSDEMCGKLRRENIALTDLLGAKKAEFEEMRYHYRDKVKGLEDDLLRVRSEKNRVMDMLKLPESERDALSIVERDYASLKRNLDQSEARGAELLAENNELKQDLRDVELEMREMHDHFEQEESLELRELQKELESTARDCRLLHFKLRKAERRNELLTSECEDYEEKLNQMEQSLQRCSDRKWVEGLEEDLRVAKEVSIQLHDECERLQLKCSMYQQEQQQQQQQQQRQQQEQQQQTQLLNKQINGGDICDNSPTADIPFLTTSTPTEPFPPSHATVLPTATNNEQLPQSSNNAGGEGDLRTRLLICEQETKSLRRKLNESRSDNESLVQAVEYLRNKLERGRGGGPEMINQGTSCCLNDSDVSSNGVLVATLNSHRENNDSIDCHSSCDIIRDGHSKQSGTGSLDEIFQNDSSRNVSLISNKGTFTADGTSVDESKLLIGHSNDFEKKSHSQQDLIGRLETECIGYRRELDALIDTLRRKEKQFADERKGLQRKNKELAQVFDMLTQKTSPKNNKNHNAESQTRCDMMCCCAEHSVAQLNGTRKNNGEFGSSELLGEKCPDIYDQSEDVKVDQDQSECDRIQTDQLNQRAREIKDLEQTVKSKDDIIKRKEFLLNRALRSLHDLERCVEDKDRLMAAEEEKHGKLEKEMERVAEEKCAGYERTIKDLKEQMTQARASLSQANELVTEKDRMLDRLRRHLDANESEKLKLTQQTQRLRADLDSTESQLKVTVADLRARKQSEEKLEKELGRSREKIQELEQEIEASCREQIKQLAEGRRERERLEGRINESERERKELVKQLEQARQLGYCVRDGGRSQTGGRFDGDATTGDPGQLSTGALPIPIHHVTASLPMGGLKGRGGTELVGVRGGRVMGSEEPIGSPSRLRSRDVTGGRAVHDGIGTLKNADIRTTTLPSSAAHQTYSIPVQHDGATFTGPLNRSSSNYSSASSSCSASPRCGAVRCTTSQFSNAVAGTSERDIHNNDKLTTRTERLSRMESQRGSSGEVFPANQGQGSVVPTNQENGNGGGSQQEFEGQDRQCTSMRMDGSSDTLSSEATPTSGPSPSTFRRREKRSDAPAAFRRSRSLSEITEAMFAPNSGTTDTDWVCIDPPQPLIFTPYSPPSIRPVPSPTTTLPPSMTSKRSDPDVTRGTASPRQAPRHVASDPRSPATNRKSPALNRKSPASKRKNPSRTPTNQRREMIRNATSIKQESRSSDQSPVLLKNCSIDQQHDRKEGNNGVVLRDHVAKAPEMSSTNRGSFYESGSMSASASREHTPDSTMTSKKHVMTSSVCSVRKISPYPATPPSMIISPMLGWGSQLRGGRVVGGLRALSVDRAGVRLNGGVQQPSSENSEDEKTGRPNLVDGNTSTIRYLGSGSYLDSDLDATRSVDAAAMVHSLNRRTAALRELSDYEQAQGSVTNKQWNGDTLRSADYRREAAKKTEMERLERKKLPRDKRSASASPRTARRKFYEDYASLEHARPANTFRPATASGCQRTPPVVASSSSNGSTSNTRPSTRRCRPSIEQFRLSTNTSPSDPQSSTPSSAGLSFVEDRPRRTTRMKNYSLGGESDLSDADMMYDATTMSSTTAMSDEATLSDAACETADDCESRTSSKKRLARIWQRGSSKGNRDEKSISSKLSPVDKNWTKDDSTASIWENRKGGITGNQKPTARVSSVSPRPSTRSQDWCENSSNAEQGKRAEERKAVLAVFEEGEHRKNKRSGNKKSSKERRSGKQNSVPAVNKDAGYKSDEINDTGNMVESTEIKERSSSRGKRISFPKFASLPFFHRKKDQQPRPSILPPSTTIGGYHSGQATETVFAGGSTKNETETDDETVRASRGRAPSRTATTSTPIDPSRYVMKTSTDHDGGQQPRMIDSRLGLSSSTSSCEMAKLEAIKYMPISDDEEDWCLAVESQQSAATLDTHWSPGACSDTSESEKQADSVFRNGTFPPNKTPPIAAQASKASRPNWLSARIGGGVHSTTCMTSSGNLMQNVNTRSTSELQQHSIQRGVALTMASSVSQIPSSKEGVANAISSINNLPLSTQKTSSSKMARIIDPLRRLRGQSPRPRDVTSSWTPMTLSMTSLSRPSTSLSSELMTQSVNDEQIISSDRRTGSASAGEKKKKSLFKY